MTQGLSSAWPGLVDYLLRAASGYNHLKTPAREQIGRHALAKNGRLIAPLRVVIELTTQCSGKCIFCIQSHARMHGIGTVKHFQITALKQLAGQLAAMGVDSVDITGGEPTCHPGFLQAVAAFKKLGIRVAIQTDGSNLDIDTVHRLGAILEPTDKLCVSLDAATASTFRYLRGRNDFKTLISGFESLGAANIIFETRTIVVRKNYDEIDLVLGLSRHLGAVKRTLSTPYRHKHIDAATHVPVEKIVALGERMIDAPDVSLGMREIIVSSGILGSPEHAELLRPHLVRCMAGHTTCSIDVNGNVGVCQFASDRKKVAGNIYTSAFAEIWDRMTRKRISEGICPAAMSA